MTVLFDQIAKEDQVPDLIIPYVCEYLKKSKPSFCLWLRGDLGAGKTTFADKLLHGLGLPSRVPVLSPTFTYLTEYKLSNGVVAHLDLYRMAAGDSESVSSLVAERSFIGLIVEWPERCPKAEEIAPTAILDIFFAADDDHKRRYVFSDRNGSLTSANP